MSYALFISLLILNCSVKRADTPPVHNKYITYSLSPPIQLRKGGPLEGVGPETHVWYIKLPMYLFCLYVAWILMLANPLQLGPLEGVGPENLDFFGPKWHSLNLIAISGPKKVRDF